MSFLMPSPSAPPVSLPPPVPRTDPNAGKAVRASQFFADPKLAPVADPVDRRKMLGGEGKPLNAY